MTLTATTNRFSTWAVVAVQEGGGAAAVPTSRSAFSLGPDPLLLCGFVGLILIGMGMRKRA